MEKVVSIMDRLDDEKLNKLLEHFENFIDEKDNEEKAA